MHASHGLFADQLFSNYQCLVQSGVYLPELEPAEADHVLVDCFNPLGVNIVTCRDDRIQSFLTEVGGLALNVAPSSTIRIFDPYIPIFDYRTIELAYWVEYDVVGLTLRDILINPLKAVGGQYIAKTIAFRDAAAIRRLCSHKKVILFLTGLDVLIETVWHQRSACELFQQLKLMGFWAVTGFNFSVFGGECPVAQRLNQKRSLLSAILLEENGLSSIPHVYAVNDFHIIIYQQWLVRNPHIHLLTINCQMQRTVEDIKQIVRAVLAMLVMNEKLHIILQGYRFSEIHRLAGVQHRIHFAESKPVKYAQAFRNTNGSLATPREEFEKEAYGALVLKNIDYREYELQQILSYAIE